MILEGVLMLRDQVLLAGTVGWCVYPIFVREMMFRGFRRLATKLEATWCFPETHTARIVLIQPRL